MPFAILDDKFHSNAKVLNVGDDGAGLFARAISYCAGELTDGWIPLGWAKAAPKARRDKLTKNNLWVPVRGGEQFTYIIENESYTVTVPGEGYFIAEYLSLNPSKAQVETKREQVSEARRVAGLKGAAARWGKRIKDGNADSNGDGKPIANAWQTDGPSTPTPSASNEALIFEVWRDESSLINHRDAYLTRGVRGVIARAVDQYGVDDVAAAIRAYAAVLGSEAHFWSHRWTLKDFLNRGLDKFVPEAEPLRNFRRDIRGVNGAMSPAEIATMFDEEVTDAPTGVRALGRGD